MLYYVALTIYVLVCLTLILVVLLQQGKGGSMANAFGGGATQAAFGARSGATVLSRATTVCAVLFVIGALYLGIAGHKGPSSVVGGRAPQSEPAPATLRARADDEARSDAAGSSRDASAGEAGEVISVFRRGRPSGGPSSSRKWRNWQTHQLEGLAVAIPWGFESPLSAPTFALECRRRLPTVTLAEVGLSQLYRELRLASHRRANLSGDRLAVTPEARRRTFRVARTGAFSDIIAADADAGRRTPTTPQKSRRCCVRRLKKSSVRSSATVTSP